MVNGMIYEYNLALISSYKIFVDTNHDIWIFTNKHKVRDTISLKSSLGLFDLLTLIVLEVNCTPIGWKLIVSEFF